MLKGMRSSPVLVPATGFAEASAASAAARDPAAELLVLLGHEMRNPVHALCTALDVLDAATPGSPTEDEARAVLRRQGQRLAALVEEFLEAGRALTGRTPSQVHAVDLARLLPRLRAESDAGTVALDLPSAPARALADGLRLEHALRALLAHARRLPEACCAVTQVGGEVQVTFEWDAAVPDDELRLVLARRLLQQLGARVRAAAHGWVFWLPAAPEVPDGTCRMAANLGRLPGVTPRLAADPE